MSYGRIIKMSMIRTFTGKLVDVHNLLPTDFNIKDTAYGLSYEKRYANQTHPVYSVGQHSVFVSHLCYPTFSSSNINSLGGLVHDVAETLCKDVPAPIKHSTGLEGYVLLENSVQAVANMAFIPDPQLVNWDFVKRMDLQARSYEKYFLHGEWIEGFVPEKRFVLLLKDIMLWSPLQTEIEFIARYLWLRAAQ